MGDRLMIGVLALLFTCSSAWAQNKELRRLSICHSIFVRELISVSDPLYQSVKNGEKSGTDACMELLSEAELGENDLITQPSASSNRTRGSKILSNFLEHARGFFKARDFTGGIGDGHNIEIHDTNTPAYHFVYSALKPNEPFSNTVTRTVDLRAKRFTTVSGRRRYSTAYPYYLITKDRTPEDTQNYDTEPYFDFGSIPFLTPNSAPTAANPCSGERTSTGLEICSGTKPCFDCVSSANNNALSLSVFKTQWVRNLYPTLTADQQTNIANRIRGAIPWEPVIAETGILNGITPSTVQNIIRTGVRNYVPFLKRVVDPVTGAVTDTVSQYVDHSRVYEENVNRHFGAGFLGSQAYLLMNNTKRFNDMNHRPDGALEMYRSWARSVYSDALCIEGATLYPSDVSASIRQNSIMPWKASTSCLGCHEQYDPAAATIRNLFLVPTSEGNLAHPTQFFASKGASKPEAPFPDLVRDEDFSFRPTKGALRFRDFEGTLVNLSVSSLPALGTAISETRQFYACSASRYFEWLTGKSVQVGNPLSPQNPVPLSPGELFLRKEIIAMGDRLKKSQSLRELLREIISSEYFINPFGSRSPGGAL